jgi:hypothetical protein
MSSSSQRFRMHNSLVPSASSFEKDIVMTGITRNSGSIEDGTWAPGHTSEGLQDQRRFHIGCMAAQEFKDFAEVNSLPLSASPKHDIGPLEISRGKGYSTLSSKYSLYQPDYITNTEATILTAEISDGSVELGEGYQERDFGVQSSRKRVALSLTALIDAYRHSLPQITGWHALRDLDAEKVETSLNVIATLGHGSIGIVHEVQLSYRISFVRKRVFLPRRTRTRLLEIVQAEARAIESLVHVHIVHIMGTYELEGKSKSDTPSFSLLMFPVGERDLAALLHDIHEDNAPGKDWLPQWFSCLTSALAYMHQQGVRHQDIKPSNIIHVGSHIYFTDFSSSAQFNPESTTSTEDPARTSAMYSPPEMLNRFEGADLDCQRHGTRSDTFSLGCVFIEMLTVLSGNSVSDLQDYLRVHGPRAPGLRYAYHTQLIHDYIRTRCNEELYEVYGWVIRPMLSLDRKDRPPAQRLLNTLFRLVFWPSSCGCSPPDLPKS